MNMRTPPFYIDRVILTRSSFLQEHSLGLDVNFELDDFKYILVFVLKIIEVQRRKIFIKFVKMSRNRDTVVQITNARGGMQSNLTGNHRAPATPYVYEIGNNKSKYKIMIQWNCRSNFVRIYFNCMRSSALMISRRLVS